MTYLIRTHNSDYFLTTDDPTLHYKREIIQLGWQAFRFMQPLDGLERVVWVGSEGGFAWFKVDWLNLPVNVNA